MPFGCTSYVSTRKLISLPVDVVIGMLLCESAKIRSFTYQSRQYDVIYK